MSLTSFHPSWTGSSYRSAYSTFIPEIRSLGPWIEVRVRAGVMRTQRLVLVVEGKT